MRYEASHGVIHRTQRKGATAVEFAVIAPILMLFIFGIIEFGRGMMVLQLLNSAAREGARDAALSGTSTSDITSTVHTRLEAEGISPEQITVRTFLNGTEGEIAGATTGDTVRVEVSLDYNNVSYLPSSWFLDGAILEGKLAMRRE